MEASCRSPTRARARTSLAALLRLADDASSSTSAADPGRVRGVYDRHHRGILSFCRHMLGTRRRPRTPSSTPSWPPTATSSAPRRPSSCGLALHDRAQPLPVDAARPARASRRRARRHPDRELSPEVQVRQDLQDMLARPRRASPRTSARRSSSPSSAPSPHEEIAGVLGCPKDKVKALVFQARSSLLSSREARETDCTDIREMLANLRGGSLRRTSCAATCATARAAGLRSDVEGQRKALAPSLPVVPTVGLKDSALAAGARLAGTAGVAAGTAAGGAGPPTGWRRHARRAKGLVIAAVTSGGVAGGVAGVDAINGDPAHTGTPATQNSNGPKTPLPAAAPVAAEPTPDAQDASDEAKAKKQAERSCVARRTPRRAARARSGACSARSPASGPRRRPKRPKRAAREGPAQGGRQEEGDQAQAPQEEPPQQVDHPPREAVPDATRGQGRRVAVHELRTYHVRRPRAALSPSAVPARAARGARIVRIRQLSGRSRRCVGRGGGRRGRGRGAGARPRGRLGPVAAGRAAGPAVARRRPRAARARARVRGGGERGAIILASPDHRALRAYARAGFAAHPCFDARGSPRTDPPAGVREGGRATCRWPRPSAARSAAPPTAATSRRCCAPAPAVVLPEARLLDHHLQRHQAARGAGRGRGPRAAARDAGGDARGAGDERGVDHLRPALGGRARARRRAQARRGGGGVFLRGDVGPFRPYIPSGAYL